MNRDYLVLPDILGIHAELIETFGGSAGIRDLGAVEAALYRPQCGYYADIFEEAAALFESILINHPFVDGNKRTAWASCDVFLRINGVTLEVEPMVMYRNIIGWLAIPPAERFTSIAATLRRLAP